jgi:hypothetical protein
MSEVVSCCCYTYSSFPDVDKLSVSSYISLHFPILVPTDQVFPINSFRYFQSFIRLFCSTHNVDCKSHAVAPILDT